MKIEMPLPYLSNSAFNLYCKDPMEYYEQYFVARVQKEYKPMTEGKIFQEAWCDKKFDYKKALQKEGFNPDRARAIETALSHHATVRLPKSKTEKEYIVKGFGLNYPILAQFDGLDPKAILIVENKWGKPWTAERVENCVYYDRDGTQRRDRQITWYILAFYIKHRKLPKFLLQSFNSKSGIPNKFWTKRTMDDLHMLVRDINTMVERVQAGDFEKY